MHIPLHATCDVLILGSGIAGIAAAMAAADRGADVILACKGKLFSGSSFYPGTWGLGLIGPENSQDEEDLMETIRSVGSNMIDPELVKAFVQGIQPALERVKGLGLSLLQAKQSNEKEFIPCFDHKHRNWNGIEFNALKETIGTAFTTRKIRVLSRHEAIQLVSHPRETQQICGAILSDGRDLFFIAAKSVILATGGYGSLFQHHLCTSDVEGVGQALALEAGCSLINMEFMQVMPGYITPAPQTIFNEKVFHHAQFFDEQGTELFADYSPEERKELLLSRSGHGPFSSRLKDGVVDVEILKHSPVKVRYTKEMKQNPPEFVKTYFDWLKTAKGVSMDDEITIALFSHAANGGIHIGTDGSTGVTGLFAAGECTGGMHGADRIGGLSTANGLVFGAKAGTAAALFSQKKEASSYVDAVAHDDYEMIAQSSTTAYCRTAFSRLQEAMSAHCLVERNAKGLEQVLETIQDIRAHMDLQPYSDTKDVTAFTMTKRLQAQLLTAEAIVQAALARQESRGSHYRSDFPQCSESMKTPLEIRLDAEGTINVTPWKGH